MYIKKTNKQLKAMSKVQLKGKRISLIAFFFLVTFIVQMCSYIIYIPTTILSVLAPYITGIRITRAAIIGLAFIGVLILLMASFLLYVGYYKCYLDTVIGKKPEIESLAYGFKNRPFRTFTVFFISLFILSIPYIPPLAWCFIEHQDKPEVTTITNIIFFLLLLISDIIVIYISIGLSQVFYLLVDFPRCSASGIVKLSFRIMRGNKWRFLLLGFSFFWHYLVVFVTCGLYSIYLHPYQTTTYTNFYMDIIREYTSNIEEA